MKLRLFDYGALAIITGGLAIDWYLNRDIPDTQMILIIGIIAVLMSLNNKINDIEDSLQKHKTAHKPEVLKK